MHDTDAGIALSVPACSGRGFPNEVTALGADQEFIIDSEEFPGERHEPVRCLRKLDAHLSHLIAQAQCPPPLRWRDKTRELVPDVIEKDIPSVANAHGLPTQEPEVLIETRRKIRVDLSDKLAASTT